jgi:ChrR Cupin-like domain
MRPEVAFLDTNAMPWERGDMAGLFTKILSKDPATGERTALQRIDPAHGYKAPTRAHYHTIDEEIFLLKGRFTFDSKQWLGRLAYCYHPAGTVHGFRSAVAEESWFISRAGRDVEFDFEDNPQQLEPYPLSGVQPDRAISVIPDPTQLDWNGPLLHPALAGTQQLVLSRHPETLEGSMLVRFPALWRSPFGAHAHDVYEEMFVLEGALIGDDGTTFAAGCYAFRPPGRVRGGMRSPDGAVAYVNFGGPLDFRPVA